MTTDGLVRRAIRQMALERVRRIYRALRRRVFAICNFGRNVAAWPRNRNLLGRLQIVRLGTVYGGGYIALSPLHEHSVVYSIGVGEEISFDEDLSRLAGCRIFGIDPTPRASEFIEDYPHLPPKYQLISVGLDVSSGIRRFYYPANPEHVSMSLVHDSGTGSIDCQFLTLPELMLRLAHSYVDLIKIDIEGAEYELLQKWLDEGKPLPVGQIWIEFHPERAGRLPHHSLDLVSRLGHIGFISLHDGHNGFLLLNRNFLQVSLRAWISLCSHSNLIPL